MATIHDPEVNSFQRGPAYRYIRATDALPGTDAASADPAPIARVKLFDPGSNWTWYIAWGLADGFEQEYGSIDMPELVAVRGRFGLPIERDLHWTPRPLAECLR